jgi:hypothetical protein
MKPVSISALCLLLSMSPAAFAVTISTDPGTGPESITAAPDGGLILGSANKPLIYRAAPGKTRAKRWIDASADGTVTFRGVLTDVATNTLWACEIGPQSAPKTPSPSSLLSFDLTSGAPKSRWRLPGDSSFCNDFTIGPDHSLYVSDMFNATIYRVRPGRTTGELFIHNQALDGVDGLTFLNGVLYANDVTGGTIWRIPLDTHGKAGTPVNISTDQPLKGPDGMRAAAGRLFVAENANGRASMLTITGDSAHVMVIRTGLKKPTAIEPAGNLLWIGDRGNDNAVSIPLPH